MTGSYLGLRGHVFPNLCLESSCFHPLLSTVPGQLVVKTDLGEWGFCLPLPKTKPNLPSADTAQP